MQKGKLQVIRQEIVNKCWTCEAKGATYNRKKDKIEICPTCHGSGLFIETHYIHIVNGIAIDGDTLK